MSQPRKGPRRLGPGSLAMVIGLVAFGLFGYLNQPGPLKTQYYEADSNGSLKLVDRPSTSSPQSSLPLEALKPEPSQILEQAASLKLSPKQRAAISQLDQRWEGQKAEFLKRMGHEQRAAEADSQAKPNVQGLSASLAEYSRLSAEYDFERDAAWQASLSLLEPFQRQQLGQIRGGGK